MEINEFVKLFAEQFEDTPADQFKPETNFRDFDEWDSLTALSVIAMVDEEFDKQITGADIRAASTILELFNIVNSK